MNAGVANLQAAGAGGHWDHEALFCRVTWQAFAIAACGMERQARQIFARAHEHNKAMLMVQLQHKVSRPPHAAALACEALTLP